MKLENEGFITRSRIWTLSVGLLVGAVLLIGTVQAHNLVLNSSINPTTGSTITDTETTLTGTFWNSGCGLDGNLSFTASSGTINPVTKVCVDGTWTWTATWSGYSAGWQSVDVEFYTEHGGRSGEKFVHTGSASANYYIQTTCDEPAAPAIANAYLRELGITNRNIYNTIIPQVAHKMNAGDFGSPCDPGYADLVRAFVDTLL